jgi:hypothetical protein
VIERGAKRGGAGFVWFTHRVSVRAMEAGEHADLFYPFIGAISCELRTAEFQRG